MNKKIINLVVFVSLFCLAGVALAVCPTGQICNPLNGVNNFNDLLEKIVTGVGTLIASLGVIMIIIAGILYLTSAGNPERINVAKKALVYAIIGIVIGIAADSIVAIIQNVLGAKTT